ncbi:non-ribosomal peptide synthetase [Streptomyces viridochromogenes]|uniref:non-ribosomal peptide synthetase n=1 Tax=Streptomyces viridochromogenes TaxID=1938 RepID=UPI00069F0AC2|nr:non-ribosomal peptide synthetase [Streptomyces viridochromogenes]KOG17255.1 amino acid adenylation protein [Streptomyces viridochromogenes]KOG20837.1 amino acid adenylation protein [Streptomyces viridochromogenes]
MAGRPAVEDVLPLSPMQEGMVFHALYDAQGHDVYTGQTALRLEGPLDAPRMSTAVGKLLARHANLRAAFRTQRSGRPVQVIRSAVRVPWQVTDLSALPPDEREPAFQRLLAEDRAERFDLARPPLLRFGLVTFDDRHHCLVISSHHLLWDGWSAPVLVRELFQLYASGGDLDALPRVRPYRDYLAWLARQDRAVAERSWRAALSGLDEPSLIAPDARDLPAEEPERHAWELSEQDTEALAATARAHGLTVSTVLQGLWAILLGRLTGRTDVVLGATVSGRDADVPGIESMVGLLINTLPVRVRLRPAEPLADLLTRLQSEQSALLDHRHLGLADIQRATGHTVLFDTLLVFESYPIDDEGIARALGTDGPRMTGVSVHDATHYPLTLTALPGARLTLTLSHRPSALDGPAVSRVAAQLNTLIGEFIEQSTTPVARLGLAPVPQPVDDLPAPDEHPLPHPTVRALFEGQAARTPDAPAVLHGDTTLTFAELDARADRLAAALVARGAGPESVVAVALNRRPDLVTALLAVLKAGAACMPVDPGYPPDRIALMLDEAQPELVICDPATAQQLGIERQLVCPPTAEAAVPLRQRPHLSPDHPAYVIFTSGSTGRPKGVIGTQLALANRLHWGRELGHDDTPDHPPHDAPGVRVSKSPLSFIDGLTELLGALVAGDAVALADDEATGDPTALAALADRHRATLLTAVPSLYTTLVETAPPGTFSSVRTWISSGETLPGELADALTRRWPQARLVNLYGCSEAAGDSLTHLHDGGEGPVPLGRPIAHTRVHVLDPFLRPSPPGAVGELYIAGDGLARGYLGQPGRTAERFVADPFGPPGSRLYRTGDLARIRPDGSVEFLGRADDQVKIRGFRVEPGEIEAAIRALPDVGRAAVVATQGGPAEDGSAPRRLVAYVVADPGAALDALALRRALAERLPAHLVPWAVVILKELPLTPSGKLDRRALPAPDFTETSTFEPPRTEPEKVLCGLFGEVLGLERVGIHDDFFERGGDSIVSVRLADRARRAGLALSPRDVFTHRTPAGLARALPDETAPAPEEFTPTGAPLVSLSQSQLDNVKARWRTR